MEEFDEYWGSLYGSRPVRCRRLKRYGNLWVSSDTIKTSSAFHSCLVCKQFSLADKFHTVRLRWRFFNEFTFLFAQGYCMSKLWSSNKAKSCLGRVPSFVTLYSGWLGSILSLFLLFLFKLEHAVWRVNHNFAWRWFDCFTKFYMHFSIHLLVVDSSVSSGHSFLGCWKLRFRVNTNLACTTGVIGGGGGADALISRDTRGELVRITNLN